MEISTSSGKEAKSIVSSFIKQRTSQFEGMQMLEFNQWLNETQDVKCYVLKQEAIVSMCLLSKMDFDPLKKYERPWTLNFIYTLQKYRRKGFARKLLSWIKKREQTTAFCSTDASENLFESLKFNKVASHPLATYRFP